MMPSPLTVCICTHNPRRDVFQLVLAALARQTLAKNAFRVCVIDNGSLPALADNEMDTLARAGVSYFIVREERLGNVHARECAIRATQGAWVVFVDDDNELAEDYLGCVLDIIQSNPQFGCFGGKLLLESPVPPPRWIMPLLNHVAIKDCGDEVLTNCVDYWGPWEPPTAGAAVKRPVLELYLRNVAQSKGSSQLGRKGRTGLLSNEDSLMMHGAFELGLQCSYQPRLVLKHHIDPSRFRFSYMVKLCYGFGRSQVLLARCLGKAVPRPTWLDVFKLCFKIPRSRKRICTLATDWGRVIESRRTETLEYL